MTSSAQSWGGRRAQRATAYVLRRDTGICWICAQPGADTLDHVIPRDTRPDLTWEPTNWKAAHGAARPDLNCPGQYARGNYPGPRRPTITTTGLLHVVTGPPTAGKTTHVHHHRQPTDIVIDLDALTTALGGPDHTTTGPHYGLARQLRTHAVQQLLDHPRPAWIIHTAPTTEDITRYTRAEATPVLIDPGRPTCMTRARTRPAPATTTAAIVDWYQHHAPRLHTWAATATTPTPHPPATPSVSDEW